MEQIPLRVLRNETSAVLRRVEAGEQITVTVDRRPVAVLSPIQRHPTWVPEARIWPVSQADPGLARDLAESLDERIADL